MGKKTKSEIKAVICCRAFLDPLMFNSWMAGSTCFQLFPVVPFCSMVLLAIPVLIC